MTPLSSSRPPVQIAPRGPHPLRHSEILREATQLFVMRPYHASSEVAQFEEMATRLADHADPQTCAEVARALIDHPCAPTHLLEKLARLSPEAALAVFGSARPVSQARLAAAAAWGPADLAAAVAGRGDLDRILIATLAQRPERNIALALAGNVSVAIARPELKALIARAREDSELAAALLPRAEGEEGAPLFLHAAPELRLQMLAAAMRRDLLAGPHPSTRLLDDEGFEATLVALARKDREQAAALLGAALDIGARAAERLLGDASGEALALAAAALGLDDDRCDLLLMFLAPGDGASVAPYERLRRLAGATPPRTARRLIDAIAGRMPAARAPERRAGAETAPATRVEATKRQGLRQDTRDSARRA